MAPGAMFSQPPPEPGADFNVVMIGAGVSLTDSPGLSDMADGFCRTSCSVLMKVPGSEFNAVTLAILSDAEFSHSFRFEHKLGPRLKVTALIDPSTARAEQVLDGKRQSFVESAYRDTKVFKTIEDYHNYLDAQNQADPE